jgi:hypothetical protein
LQASLAWYSKISKINVFTLPDVACLAVGHFVNFMARCPASRYSTILTPFKRHGKIGQCRDQEKKGIWNIMRPLD